MSKKEANPGTLRPRVTENFQPVDDSLCDIEICLTRASRIQQDIEEDYFGYLHAGGHEMELIYHYRNFAVKAEIVGDYMQRAHDMVRSLMQSMKEAKQ